MDGELKFKAHTAYAHYLYSKNYLFEFSAKFRGFFFQNLILVFEEYLRLLFIKETIVSIERIFFKANEIFESFSWINTLVKSEIVAIDAATNQISYFVWLKNMFCMCLRNYNIVYIGINKRLYYCIKQCVN